MVCFQTKNPDLGKFWRVLDWKRFIYFIAIWCFYGDLGYFMAICYTLYSFFVAILPSQHPPQRQPDNLYSFGTFFPVLVSFTKKNLATLVWQSRLRVN
jgi:hypothetical protein